MAASGSQATAQAANALQAQLRASLTAYVAHLRDGGMQSEGMIIRVKSVVHAATPDDVPVSKSRRLMEDVVRWSIEAYYL